MKKSIIFLIISQLIFARFPDAVGYNGAVVSSNEHASQVGLDILAKGGNAIDAAIGVGFALAVVHPGAGNIGGGGFMVIRTADGEVTTIDFRETAPAKAHRDKVKKAGFKSSKDYANTMARYGGEDNYKKGRGLGT